MDCTDCHERPATAAGLCTRDYQRRRRAGTLPARESTVPLALRVPESTHAALEREAKRRGESVYAVALRWLASRAAR